MKRVSLEMIAKEVNLSKTTVSMVLNGKGDMHKINPETQKLIYSVAERLRFRPNMVARNLSKGRSMTLALIVPRIIDTYYSHIAESMEQITSKLGYQVLLGTTHEDPAMEKELLLTFEAQQVDGILIASTQHNLEDIKTIYQGGLPIVLFDRHYPEADLPYVVVDNYLGTQKLVKYLRETGRKNIGYVGLNLDLTAIKDRQKGYRNSIETKATEGYNLKIVDHRNAKSDCRRAVEELILNQNVDGIVFETQYLALFGIARIREMHVDYPGTVSIASFGDHEVFSIFRPEVTALVLPVEQIAQRSIDMLMGQIEHKPSGKTELHEVIRPSMEVRNT
ncbi:MAG: LacI family transcriptional regulator [Cytophagales bacterium]|nr:LacI family transcriptional regulator [Cytophagales bacterium]